MQRAALACAMFVTSVTQEPQRRSQTPANLRGVVLGDTPSPPLQSISHLKFPFCATDHQVDTSKDKDRPILRAGLCVCVCVCLRVCMHMCVCVCVCVYTSVHFYTRAPTADSSLWRVLSTHVTGETLKSDVLIV